MSEDVACNLKNCNCMTFSNEVFSADVNCTHIVEMLLLVVVMVLQRCIRLFPLHSTCSQFPSFAFCSRSSAALLAFKGAHTAAQYLSKAYAATGQEGQFKLEVIVALAAAAVERRDANADAEGSKEDVGDCRCFTNR